MKHRILRVYRLENELVFCRCLIPSSKQVGICSLSTMEILHHSLCWPQMQRIYSGRVVLVSQLEPILGNSFHAESCVHSFSGKRLKYYLLYFNPISLIRVMIWPFSPATTRPSSRNKAPFQSHQRPGSRNLPLPQGGHGRFGEILQLIIYSHLFIHLCSSFWLNFSKYHHVWWIPALSIYSHSLGDIVSLAAESKESFVCLSCLHMPSFMLKGALITWYMIWYIYFYIYSYRS